LDLGLRQTVSETRDSERRVGGGDGEESSGAAVSDGLPVEGGVGVDGDSGAFEETKMVKTGGDLVDYKREAGSEKKV
jgi:hypothetical protein